MKKPEVEINNTINALSAYQQDIQEEINDINDDPDELERLETQLGTVEAAIEALENVE